LMDVVDSFFPAEIFSTIFTAIIVPVCAFRFSLSF
jgi:hypothetical protein